MIITHRIGDLLDQPDIDVIVHQANIHHTFGAGIAKFIRQQFPYAYKADLATVKDDIGKLGTYSIGSAWDSGVPVGFNPMVINMYSQVGMTITSYDLMVMALGTLAEQTKRMGFKRVGFPYGMGCGLADGNWEIVKVIIAEAFKDVDVEIVIVKLPE